MFAFSRTGRQRSKENGNADARVKCEWILKLRTSCVATRTRLQRTISSVFSFVVSGSVPLPKCGRFYRRNYLHENVLLKDEKLNFHFSDSHYSGKRNFVSMIDSAWRAF